MREVGRAAFLRAVDGARAAARSLGAHLADTGVLKDPEDVFFLTMDELTGTLPDGAAELVAQRRAWFTSTSRSGCPMPGPGDPRRSPG